MDRKRFSNYDRVIMTEKDKSFHTSFHTSTYAGPTPLDDQYFFPIAIHIVLNNSS